MLSDFNRKPLSHEVLTFMGEFLEEDKNKPVKDEVTGEWSYVVPDKTGPCDRNLVSRALDLYRDRFDGSVGYGVYNLITILKKTRKMLAGENFSDLDFSHCILNNTHIGLLGIETMFQGAKIQNDTLFCKGHKNPVKAVAFSSDGMNVISFDTDGIVMTWNTQTGEHRLTFGSSKNFRYLSDGSFAAYCQSKGIVATSMFDKTIVWDSITGTQLYIVDGQLYGGFDFSPSMFSIKNKFITSTSSEAKIRNIDNGNAICTLECKKGRICGANCDDNGAFAVTVLDDHSITIWSIETEPVPHSLREHQDRITSANFSISGDQLVTASWDHTVKIWNTDTGAIQHNLEHPQAVTNAIFSPDGKMVLTLCYDNIVRVWSSLTGELLFSLVGHTNYINMITFNFDGSKIATASLDNTVKIWSASNGTLLHTLRGNSSGFSSVFFSPDGKSVAASSHDATILLWSVETGEIMQAIEGSCQEVSSALIFDKGTKVITSSYDRTAKIWSTVSGKLLYSLDSHSDKIYSLNLDETESIAATSSRDGTVKLWDICSCRVMQTIQDIVHWCDEPVRFGKNGEEIAYITEKLVAKKCRRNDNQMYELPEIIYTNAVCATYNSTKTKRIVATLPFSIKIESTCNDDTILWEEYNDHQVNHVTVTGDETKIIILQMNECLNVHSLKDYKLLKSFSNISTFKLSNNETILAAGTSDGSLIVYDFRKDEFFQIQNLHESGIRTINFCSDDTMIVTSAFDNYSKICFSDSGKLISALNGHSSDVKSARFCSTDKSLIVTACDDGRAMLWNSYSGKCIQTFPHHYGLSVFGCDFRNLHPESQLSEEDKAILKQYGAIVD